MRPFVVDRRQVVERGVTPMGVVPALDELEHCHARLDLGPKAAAGEQLALQGREEALAHRVVEAIADRAHRRGHPGFAAARDWGGGAPKLRSTRSGAGRALRS